MDQDVLKRAKATVQLAAKLAVKGHQKSALTFAADWQPNCDTPREIYRAVKPGTFGLRSVEVAFKVPCRRCDRCTTYKRLQWRERAMIEVAQVDLQNRRTWFLTLTFSPAHLAGILMRAKDGSASSVEAQAYPHVQKYFKRLRKIGHRFRYLAIYERGEKTGRSHYHVLLHELGPRPIPKDSIEAQWRSHVHARLVAPGDGCSSYVTKYLTKSLCRPRASSRYGTREKTK